MRTTGIPTSRDRTSGGPPVPEMKRKQHRGTSMCLNFLLHVSEVSRLSHSTEEHRGMTSCSLGFTQSTKIIMEPCKVQTYGQPTVPKIPCSLTSKSQVASRRSKQTLAQHGRTEPDKPNGKDMSYTRSFCQQQINLWHFLQGKMRQIDIVPVPCNSALHC